MENNEIREKIREIFNVEVKDHQLQALCHLLSTDPVDLLINLPVGYGKSLIYQAFPILHSENAISLVITPLNIIQKDQLDSLRERYKPFLTIKTYPCFLYQWDIQGNGKSTITDKLRRTARTRQKQHRHNIKN